LDGARGRTSHDLDSQTVCTVDVRDGHEPPFWTPRSTHDRDS
jgi:hypothetical protein